MRSSLYVTSLYITTKLYYLFQLRNSHKTNSKLEYNNIERKKKKGFMLQINSTYPLTRNFVNKPSKNSNWKLYQTYSNIEQSCAAYATRTAATQY